MRLGLGLGLSAVRKMAGAVTPTLFRYAAGDSLAAATKTRASSATYRDIAGVIQTAATDVMRDGHYALDPVSTLYKRTLLLEGQRTNLLLNSETLSTQNVTVAAVAHTLSFYGTGTITLSGVSTAGPLVGTGAANRVTLTFTPTAGVLVLTVTGSVTKAQLEEGTFASSYIPTTSAAVTRAADSLTFPFTEPRQEMTVFGRTIDHGSGAGVGIPGFFLLGSGAGRFRLYGNGAAHNVDNGTSQSELTSTIALGASHEFRVVLSAAYAVRYHESLNAAAEASGTQGADFAMPAFGSATAKLNEVDGGILGHNAFRDFIVFPGTKTLAECRAEVAA